MRFYGYCKFFRAELMSSKLSEMLYVWISEFFDFKEIRVVGSFVPLCNYGFLPGESSTWLMLDNKR